MRPAFRIGWLLLPLGLVAAGPPDPIRALLTDVRDGHEDVRRSACDALADLGPDAGSAVPDLLDALEDRSWRGRWSAAAALLHIAPTEPAVTRAIVSALGDPSNVDREDIAYSLERVYPRPTWAVPVLANQVKDKQAGYAAASTLAAFGPDAAAAVPSLIESVHSNDEDTRAHACHALGRIGAAAKPAVPALAELLASPDKRNRAAAASALCDLGALSEAAVPTLVRATQDHEIDIRIEAAFTLGRIGYAQSKSLPAFKPPLKD